MKTTTPILIFMFGLFGIVGLCIAISSTRQFYSEYQIEKNYLTAKGEITNFNQITMGDSVLIAPVITYTTQDSQIVQHKSDHYCNHHDYKIGQKFMLWYDPKDTQKISYDHGERFTILYFALFALVFGGVGFGGLYWQYRIYREGKWIAKHGVLIQTTFLKEVHYYWIKGRPSIIMSTWTDPKTRIPYEFESRYFYGGLPVYDPKAPILVRIDPKNPVIHRMEI